MDTVKSLLNCLKQSPLWFVVPSIILFLGVGLTISGYSPLVFDPSLYQTQSALAFELKSIDANALEGKGSKALSSNLGTEKLKDGEYTGYAPCGEGNPDGWKPYYVAVTIIVKDGKVVSISGIGGSSTGNDGDAVLNWDAAENQRYMDSAVGGVQPQMESQIRESGYVSGVDTVSGATYSSVAVYNAYANAIAKAGGKVQAVSVPTASGSSGAIQKLAGKQVAATGLADGDWTSYAACGKGNDDGWKPYYVAVTVKVKGGKVVGVTQVSGTSKGEKGSASLSWDASENQKYLSWAVDGRNGNAGVKSQINSQLSSKGAVSGVDTVSGATYSSRAIYEAYVSAVNKAAKAGGGKATKAKKTTKKKATKKKKKSNKKKKTVVTVSDDMSKQAFADGIWIGYADCGVGNEDEWKPYYVSVTVKVSGGKVVSVGSPAGSSTGDSGSAKLNWDASENGSYLGWAAGGRTRSGKTYTGVIAQIQAAIASGGLPKSIDVVSGATYSSQSLLQAFYAALKKSAAKAGSTIAEPDKPSGGGDEPGGSGESPDPGGSDEPGGSGESPDPGGSDEPGGSGESPDPGGSDEPSGEDETPCMVDGTYTGYAFCQEGNSSSWEPYYIIVNLEVVDSKISRIVEAYGDTEGVIDPNYKYSAGQNKTYLDRAIKGYGTGSRHKPGVVEQINNALASGTVPTTCDTISAATYSSLSIIQAYNMALAEAQATATTS